MSVLSEEYLHSLCEVKDYDKKISFRGYLNKIDDSGFQVVRGGSLPLPSLVANQSVDIQVFNNVYGNVLFVGRINQSTKNYVKIYNIQSKAEFEKRQFFRVDTIFPAKAFRGENALEAVNNLKFNANATSKLDKFDIDIDNLSISGIHIVLKNTDKSLDVPDNLVVIMKLEEKELILPITVRRATTNRQGEPNGYGCSFDLSEGWEIDTIGNYLFACQRKQIQKARYGVTEDDGKKEEDESIKPLF
ncbi:MAG: PilZ domain-containing protein [Clostridiales bacterium]|nr:PilZ domain-containing protein [Clostridiales bacterium]